MAITKPNDEIVDAIQNNILSVLKLNNIIMYKALIMSQYRTIL